MANVWYSPQPVDNRVAEGALVVVPPKNRYPGLFGIEVKRTQDAGVPIHIENDSHLRIICAESPDLRRILIRDDVDTFAIQYRTDRNIMWSIRPGLSWRCAQPLGP